MEKLNPIDLVVRLSLEQGFPALLDIVVEFTGIPVEKRLAKMKYNKNLKIRLEKDAKWQPLTRQSDYTRFAHRCGATGFSLDTAKDIVKYDDIPKWRSLFAKYTNNNYNSEGSILIERPALTIFAAMLDTPGMGQAGVNNILFWNVFLQMLNYADPAWVNQGYEIPTEACYYHVARVLKEALVTPYLQTQDLPDTDVEHLFPSWTRAMAFTARQMWVVKKSVDFDWGEANADYYRGTNSISLQAGLFT
ncbi:hypothetical protein MRX96_043607 [Rhipicephalus microplus]